MTDQTPQPAEKHYASVKNPSIEAALQGLYRFPDEATALKQLEALKEHFILSKHQAPNQDHPSLILWIRGYNVTKQEEKDGLVGNYALLTHVQLADGKYTITATKLESERKFHPQKRRLPSKHPNWAHPILREIKKGKCYASVEEAQADIQTLHEEYPETTIPCSGKAYVMVFERADKAQKPIQKYVLEVKIADGGGFYLDIQKNTFVKEQIPLPASQLPAGNAPNIDAPGKFASQVALGRAKKGNFKPSDANA